MDITLLNLLYSLTDGVSLSSASYSEDAEDAGLELVTGQLIPCGTFEFSPNGDTSVTL